MSQHRAVEALGLAVLWAIGGVEVETYDAVFHPKTVQLANDSPKFMCFLVEICVEHINEGYQKSLVPGVVSRWCLHHSPPLCF